MSKAMNFELKILRSLLDRIERTGTIDTGLLYGTRHNNSFFLLGFSFEPKQDNESKQSRFMLSDVNLPVGVSVCGFIKFMDCDMETATQQLKEKLCNTNIPNQHYAITCVIQDFSKLKVLVCSNSKYIDKSYQVIEDSELWKQFLHIRIKSKLPITCEMSTESFLEAVTSLQKKISHGMLAFAYPKVGLYLQGEHDGSSVAELRNDSVCEDLYALCLVAHSTEQTSSKGKKRNNAANFPETLLLEMLMKPTAEGEPETRVRAAPVIQYVKRHYECLKLWIHIDTLTMVNRKAALQDVYKLLQVSVDRNLQLSERCLVQQLSQLAGDNRRFSLPMPLHFLPEKFGHFVTLAYPKSAKEDDLLQVRSDLHQQFELPLDRPFFRRANAHTFRSELPNNIPLINPHETLGPSGVKGGEVAIVQGLYNYHHYMQDRMDDDGWGCAYRSLQTLVSWFRWQGYTDKPIPSHKDIQECLVSIGDKPATFVGSRQWIGSTEVSFCLETMLGVTSRILSVSSGEELGFHGSDLLEHFRTHGTPIMIGGGVLAHTIIGVHFCNVTGSIKFLILDPHYTGGEDLSVIQSKGWCGWKGLEFWKKGAFYNLCMPLRPLMM